MKHFPNNTRLVESIDELPDLTSSKRLYLDFETASGNPQLVSTNPWHNCDIAGIGITVDDTPHAYYIPVGCSYEGESKRNLPSLAVYLWLARVIRDCDYWINHNVKYDAHVFYNCTGVTSEPIEGLMEQYPIPTLIDTMALAKLVDSDRKYKGGYGLSILSKDWLAEDISSYEDLLRPYLKTSRGQYYNKDYGNIPIDIIAPYCGQDVLTVRKLSEFIKRTVPKESLDVMTTECKLTQELFRMERHGILINPNELQVHQLYCFQKLIEIEEELLQDVGYPFLPSSNKQVHDVLVNHYGLPVLLYNEKGNPSFDKKALIEYSYYPDSPTRVVKNIVEHRKHHHFNGLFLQKYIDLCTTYSDYSNLNGDSGYSFLHPDINQTVETGRMSMRDPNMQQLNPRAKKLIKPLPGWMFISIDYSQIEFRLIVHYIQNREAIAAYEDDPDTDFHSWIQEKLPGDITRSRAKTINFAMGYGTGIKGMGENMALMHDLREKAGNDRQRFLSLCRQRGSEIYHMYHNRFPELKRTSEYYESLARAHGYVTNLHGRRRYLPQKVAHIAFNTINQGDAADIMKDRLVAVCEKIRDIEIYPLTVVHDEILFTCPRHVGMNHNIVKMIVECMESPRIQDKLTVPIRCKVGMSDKSWADCGNNEFTVPYKIREKVDV